MAKKQKKQSDHKGVVSHEGSMKKKGRDATSTTLKKEQTQETLVLHLDAEVYEALREIKALFSEAVGKDVTNEEVIGTLISGFVEGLNEDHEGEYDDEEDEHMHHDHDGGCCGEEHEESEQNLPVQEKKKEGGCCGGVCKSH